ncbi:MAG TPA: hypothetical protein VNZ64_18900 [Candidatus Acidoferrum sp.]|jgi:hypothetical protein|nr:hypothetical protein [Candidatus Acidoferrum sp.]
MNSENETKLAAELDLELKSLPELRAPSTLMRRVMAAIEARDRLPWYRQSWQAWPEPARAASLLLLTVFFAALCLGVWKIPDTESYSAATHQAAGWFAGLTTLWNALNTLIGTLAHAVQQLGRGFLIGCLAAVALAWAMCLGLGTACVRLALARR